MGPVVIGNTAKGPAMQPIMVSSIAELERVFGAPSNGNPGAVDVWRTGAPTSPTLATYAAKAFLQNASPITVMRLAGVEKTSEQTNAAGWQVGETYELYAVTGSNQMLVARIYASGSGLIELSGSGAYPGAKLTIDGTDVAISLDSTKPEFIRNVLNTNPSKYGGDNGYGYFLGESFEESFKDFGSFDELFLTSSSGGGYTSVSGAVSAETGYVVSDMAEGEEPINLFKFVGLNSGASLSKDIKISIENVRASRNQSVTKYGTFDVVIRKLFETQTQGVLERFSGVSLDSLADNYIVKAVGDSYRTWNAQSGRYMEMGTYPNRSAFVRVVMDETVDIPASALPHGFQLRNVPATLTGSHPEVELVTSIKIVSAKTNRFGIESNAVDNADLVDLLAYAENVDFGDKIFHTRYVTTSGSFYAYDITEYNTGSNLLLSGSFAGFDMPLYGGFDAKDITVAESFINNDILSAGSESDNPAYRAIKQAIDMVGNAENIDMNLLCIPGLQNSDLTDRMLEVCKTRGDAMAIIDLEGDYRYGYENSDGKEYRPTSVTSVVNALNGRVIDNSYAAAYFPAVFVPSAGIFMPASVAALGAIGGTEGREALWFAPAGFNRGGLTELTSGISVSRTAFHLVSSDRDDLYDASINPIATFPNEGVVIFGQKTLQQTPSALDRVNVRRLVNYIKKEVSRAATRILFDPNVEATWNRFKSVVEPFLLQIKNAYGLEDSKVVLDETTTTADLVDRNIMYCKLYIKPTRALEYIAIDFIVTNSGAAFTQ